MSRNSSTSTSSGGRSSGPTPAQERVVPSTETTAESGPATDTVGSAGTSETISTAGSADTRSRQDVGGSAQGPLVAPAPLAAVRADVGRYDLTNTSRGLRVVHDAQFSPVAVGAGKTRRGVQLTESVARRINAKSERTGLSAAPSA